MTFADTSKMQIFSGPFGFARDRVVFEVVENDEVEDPSYLPRPDFIKLDIALLNDIDRDPFKAMLAAKIIEAARALEMTVVAEGIETAGEFHWLRDNGAHLLQGFYLARPAAIPATAVALQP